MPDADDAPVTDVEVSEEEAQIKEAWDIVNQGTSESAATDDPTDDGQAEEAQESTSEAVAESDEGTSSEATKESEEEAAPEVDISWAPDGIKDRLSEVAKENPDLVPAYRDIYKSMQGDYTRKTQDVADERKGLEAERQFIDIGKAVLSTPEGQKRFADFLGGNVDAADESDEFDHTLATKEEFDAHIDRKVERKLERREAMQQRESETRTQAEQAVYEAFQEAGEGVEEEAYLEALSRFRKEADQEDADYLLKNPSKVARFMRPYIDEVLGEKRKAQKSKEDVARAARASSPSGVASVPPRQVPKWEAEKRAPTNDELIQMTLSQARERGFNPDA